MKINLLKSAIYLFIIVSIVACKSDDGDLENNNLKDSYSVDRFKVLNIATNFPIDAKLTWSVNDSLISETRNLDFISPYVKTYPLTLKVETNGKTDIYHSKIIVNKELKAYSQYISDVFDFRPAVGQFTNKTPKYENGNNAFDLLQRAKLALIGDTTDLISLGGFGGYVVFGFDHTIPNLEGRDFKVLGNAFWANASTEVRTGSCEPGIIMVAYDKNKNGKPDDDEWYEIAGSEYFKNTTTKNYSITYFKPNENKPPVNGPSQWQYDVEYVKWNDNQGNSGYKTKNVFNIQSYYPLWITDLSYSFTGTKLANNFYDQSGNGSYWVGKSYAYGYADNAPNGDEASDIDISWAVNKNGNYVKLPGIDFVKVYTGINQEAGWLGEISTEVAGAYDLRLK